MRCVRWIALCWALAGWYPVPASAWEIAEFETAVAVHEDATATITETIIADFTGESRHGIYRDIPVQYTDRLGQHFTLRLAVLEVAGAGGWRWPYRLESAGRYQRLVIGDPDRTVTGQQTYRIVYRVDRGAVRFFPDHDECYWNLTGNEWAVPMRQVRARIELPGAARRLRAIAYVGGYGSTVRLSTVETTDHRVVLEVPHPLAPYEGLTAVVGWEKGMVQPPSAWRVFGWWAQDNWVYGVPLLVLLGMVWLWHARGREPRLSRSRVVEYEPPEGLTPAEAGALFDQRVDMRDITANVIALAVRGHLKIELQESSWWGGARDYRLIRLQPAAAASAASLKPHEHVLLQGLFERKTGGASVLLSELDEAFYAWVPKISDAVYDTLVRAGAWESDPRAVCQRYLLFGGILGAVVWVGLSALPPGAHVTPAAVAVIAVLSALIVVGFSWAMPRRTIKGAQLTDRLFGYLEFLRRADQDRLRRLNDPSLFERGLPYALAFGVTGHWARAFEGLYAQPPAWYAGHWDQFSTVRLSHDLHRATASMGRAFASQPRASGGSSSSWGGSGFGGGGSSGGGGGGGGGGAW